MRSLKDRLNSISGLLKNDSIISQPDEKKAPCQRLQECLPDSKIINTEEGILLSRKISFPLPLSWGAKTIKRCLPISPLLWLDKQRQTQDASIDKIIYFDLETTGLAGGTGTYPFLTGLGYFTPDTFEIQQVFLVDYDQESAYLNYLHKIFTAFDVIVSFNGKSFDLPLLNTRLKLQKITEELRFKAHIDLLHPSRSLWNRVYENVKLKTIEANYIGFERIDDIPGAEIPAVYFDYLSEGNVENLAKVFEHNIYDIVSLACLSENITQFIIPDDSLKDNRPEEIFGVGKMYYLRKEYLSAITFFEAALKRADSSILKIDLYRYLSFTYKKMGNYLKALQCWEKLAELSPVYRQEALIEMAKYYEHHEKDYNKALQMIDNCMALNPFEIMDVIQKKKDERDNLNKRKNRLMQKSLRMGNKQNER
jgi:uncharacterized protein YprB with RNaseH-like and TPR domain